MQLLKPISHLAIQPFSDTALKEFKNSTIPISSVYRYNANTMKFVPITKEHKQSYDTLVNNRPEATCLQMWEWAEFRNALHKDLYFRLGVIDDDKLHLVATCQVSNYKFFGNVLYIPQGPIWDDPNALTFFSKSIGEIAAQRKCHLIVLEPRVFPGDERYKQLQSLGYKHTPNSIQPRETVLVDLDQDDDTLFASLQKNTRYNINYAKRKGIVIKSYRKPTEVDRIDTFYSLLKETQSRNNFTVQPKEYFQKLWLEFSAYGHAQLFEAWYKDEVLSTIIMLYNDVWATSMFSSSTRKLSNLKHTYLLRWESILEAKKNGCKSYDFFGATASKDPSHPFYHTTEFKLHFGKKVTSYAGTFEMILDPVKYRYYLWKIAENFGIIKFYEKTIIKGYRNSHAT